MERLEPTRALAFKVWWARAWRTAVGVTACALAIAAVFVAIHLAFGVSIETLTVVEFVLSPFVAAVVWIEATYRMLKKAKFKEFELALLSRQE